MTIDAQTGTTQARAPESIPTVPKRDQVIELIIRETGCSWRLANSTINWVSGFVDEARAGQYATQYPTTRQMRKPEYRIFDQVVVHGGVAAVGSAHEALEALLLRPDLDETTLVHDQRDEPGSPRYCVVQVCLNVIRT